MTDDTALRLTIQGVEVAIEPPFTNRELHLIKQIAGVRAGELSDAINSGDSDVLVALAHIGLRRAGRTRPTVEELWELPATAIDLVLPDVEPDEEPDPTPAAAGAGGEPGNPATTPPEPGDPNTATSSA